MEEDSEVKAPVTRLRRRASIEAADNVNSPATPTKKKGGRLAAKPLLDNIDENAPVSSPKPTRRRSVARDDPVEEKLLTPARRSTRIRSNTSLTSETPQGFDSPRAKRISRRNSLAGSDNESTVTTPVKQTRRTRKASTSSVENAGEPIYIIAEEPDSKTSEGALSNDENLSPNNVRKSARLLSKPRKSHAESPAVQPKPKKNNRKSSSPKHGSNGPKSLQNGETSFSSEKSDLLNEIDTMAKDSTKKHNSSKEKSTILSTSLEAESLNLSSTNKSSTTNTAIIEKSTKTEADVNYSVKTNLNANVAASLQNSSANDTKDITDSVNTVKSDALAEMIVEKNQNPVECTVFIDDSSSNTGSVDKERDDDQCVPVLKQETLSQIPPLTNASIIIFQEKDRSISSSTVVACEPMDIDETMPDNVSLKEFETSLEKNNSINIKNNLSISQSKNTSQLNEAPNQTESVKNNKSSDTSALSSSMEKKNNKSKRKSSLSQLVTSTNMEKEIETSASNTPTLDKSKKKSSLSQSISSVVVSAEEDVNKSATNAEETVNISKRESTLTGVETSKGKSKNKSLTQSIQDLEKSSNENKSTLILSQIKDDETSLARSPKVTNSSHLNEKKSLLKVNQTSKITNISNIKSTENTPLKEKALKTLGMQTSTPVISNNIAKGKQKNPLVENPKTSKTNINKTQDTSDNSSEDSESVESDFMDDEAEDAGDDYESGDSRDDEEIQYAEENEIVERGETLDSDDEASNDTDYEKDSFVVSSDPEDNELLDGSEDDLNLSDNELTMSAKSKKKYNERKLKEQKKASREMFESRHKNKSLYESSSSSEDEKDLKPKKKNNRLRLDSSALGSEDDPVKSVKSKRMRINSTLDDSSNNTNFNVSTNKKKGLWNSSTDAINENEITAIADESMFKKRDPLKVDVKLEPQTPQKDLDISTVNFSTHLPISEIQVNENVSMVETNETSDPLQEDDDDSLCSENQDIMDNYDSVLKDLNNSKQNKSLDTSNKSKKTKKSIVDELNLTGTKAKAQEASKKENKLETSGGFDDDDSSSNSIDLKLLFPDNESDSEDEGAADFISLKKAEAKTDIRTDTSIGGNVQKMSIDMDVIDGQPNLEEPVLNTNQNSAESDINVILPIQSQNDRSKKKKQKISISTVDDSDQNNSFNENSTEMLKTKEKNTSLSERKKNECLEYLNTESNEIVDESHNHFEKSKKKVQKTFYSEECKDVSEHDLSGSTELQDTSLSNKKHSVTETDTNDEDNDRKDESEQNTDTIEAQDTSLTKKKKKNRKHSVTETDTNDEDRKDESEQNTDTMEVQNTSFTKKKNKKSIIRTDADNEDLKVSHETLPNVVESKDELEQNKTTESLNTSLSKKKKKKHSISLNETKDTSLTKIKNKNNSATGTDINEKDLEAVLTMLPQDDDANEHKGGGSHKKKKNKSDANSADISTTVEPETETVDFAVETYVPETHDSINADVVTGKKRKRKSSGATAEVREGANADSFPAAGGEKKKIKLANSDDAPHTDENIFPESQPNISDSSTQKKKKKKDNDKKIPDSEDVNAAGNAKQSKKNKKRKERDDDEEQNHAKLFKESHQNNINVPRLPSSLLQKLEVNSKPNQAPIIKKVVSTTNFVVEEGKRRKNKPSHYLEESVYLDSESPDKKKNVGKIKKPKVLPFVPTASTSSYGFTSNFKVNVIPTETKFIAQSSNISNFKNDYLYGKTIKRMGTYELYKKQRTLKLSKF